MAFTFGFYNSLNGDRKYDAIQMSKIFDGVIRDGIFASIGAAMMVRASTGMTVVVGTGRAWFNRTWTLNDSDYPIIIAPSEVLQDRIDTIVLEIDSTVAVRANTYRVIKGTPSTNPVAPTLVTSSEKNQYPLCDIRVNRGVTSITQANITNRVGTSRTPFVTGILDTVNIDSLLAQWETQFTQWLNSLVDLIDDNVAASLAAEILVLKNSVSRIETVFVTTNATTNNTATNFAVNVLGGFPTIAKSYLIQFNATTNANATLNMNLNGAYLIRSVDGKTLAAGAIAQNSIVSISWNPGGWYQADIIQPKREIARFTNSQTWTVPAEYRNKFADVFFVAAGGGGGPGGGGVQYGSVADVHIWAMGSHGGGGGGGACGLTTNIPLSATAYPLTIGKGGSGGTIVGNAGTSGESTVGFGIIYPGGTGGGSGTASGGYGSGINTTPIVSSGGSGGNGMNGGGGGGQSSYLMTYYIAPLTGIKVAENFRSGRGGSGGSGGSNGSGGLPNNYGGPGGKALYSGTYSCVNPYEGVIYSPGGAGGNVQLPTTTNKHLVAGAGGHGGYGKLNDVVAGYNGNDGLIIIYV